MVQRVWQQRHVGPHAPAEAVASDPTLLMAGRERARAATAGRNARGGRGRNGAGAAPARNAPLPPRRPTRQPRARATYPYVCHCFPPERHGHGPRDSATPRLCAETAGGPRTHPHAADSSWRRAAPCGCWRAHCPYKTAACALPSLADTHVPAGGPPLASPPVIAGPLHDIPASPRRCRHWRTLRSTSMLPTALATWRSTETPLARRPTPAVTTYGAASWGRTGVTCGWHGSGQCFSCVA